MVITILRSDLKKRKKINRLLAMGFSLRVAR
jgi:hypothetical protein